MKAIRLYIAITIALLATNTFISCEKDIPEDWSEVINLYVDAELGEYRPWGHPEDADPLDGLKIKESKDADWEIIPMDGIDGFTHSLGWEFYLEVEKVHLANPPADASNVRYRLIKIVNEQKVRTPDFPTLEIKGAQGALSNSYTANIFEPVHFYLDGNDYMQQDLRELCDSLADRNNFIKSTRLTLEENYPHFFIYLHDKGLEEFEIDFCCLYAIGLKGKEVKAYTNLSRHYKDSSEVRQKLGLVESDTNLSNFLQKLLKKGIE